MALSLLKLLPLFGTVLLVFVPIREIYGLQCYTCTANANLNPAVTCPSGKTSSGCADGIKYCETKYDADGTVNTMSCATSCTSGDSLSCCDTDLCNIGDPITTVSTDATLKTTDAPSTTTSISTTTDKPATTTKSPDTTNGGAALMASTWTGTGVGLGLLLLPLGLGPLQRLV